MTGLALSDGEALRRYRLRDTLRGLVPAYRALSRAVRHPIRRSSGTGEAPVPLDVAAFDALHHGDHEGHPGMIRSLLAAEDVTRAALGHGPRLPRHLDEQIPAAVTYLSAQLDLVLDARDWTPDATRLVDALAEHVITRIDVDRVRLDYDLTRRDAAAQLAAIEDGELAEDGELDALHADLATTPEDYLEGLYSAVRARYRVAGSDAAGWADYLTAEIHRLATRAAALLDVRAHSTAGAATCPWCGHAIGLTRDDPDLAACSGCRRQWRISTGEAELHFGAWRNAGWEPQPWRDTA